MDYTHMLHEYYMKIHQKDLPSLDINKLHEIFINFINPKNVEHR